MRALLFLISFCLMYSAVVSLKTNTEVKIIPEGQKIDIATVCEGTTKGGDVILLQKDRYGNDAAVLCTSKGRNGISLCHKGSYKCEISS